MDLNTPVRDRGIRMHVIEPMFTVILIRKGRFTMKAYQKWFGVATAACFSMIAAQSANAVAINEFRIDHAGADTDEFFELAGTPGESLNGLTYIVIGDTSPSLGGGSVNTGAIEVAIPLDGLIIPADGFFLAIESIFVGPAASAADLVIDLNFENSDNVTHLLVSGFTGADGDLIDDDRDGLINATLPWTSIIDGLALEELVNSGEFNYGSQLGVPILPAQTSGENYGHAYRDVDITGTWLGGFAELGLSTETPGRSNVPLNGDINNDGFVGIEDLNIVLGNWNAGTPPTGGTPSIPEPASFALLSLGCVSFLRRRSA